MSNEVGVRRSSEIKPSVMQTSRRGYPYTDVHVLLLYWEDGNKDFYEQLQKLGKKLKSSFSYEVEEYALQSKEPYRTLNKKLTDFLDNGHENALLIIYYGGHGGINKDRNHVWLCNDPTVVPDERLNPNINWSSLQQLLLQDCKSHILLLLDCCKASASIQYTSGTSVVEAITAAGFENVTPLRGIHSFTSNLVSTLDDLQGRPITASHLCSKITARLKSYWPREVGNEKRVTPHHFSFNDDIETDVVVIARMGQTIPLRIMESATKESVVEVTQAETPREDKVSLQQSSEATNLLSATPSSSLVRSSLSMQVERPASDSRSPSLGPSDAPQFTYRSRKSRSPRSRSRLNIQKPGLRPPPDIEINIIEHHSQLETYKHIPINDGEIRILHLLPGRDNEPIRCAFSTRILENDHVEREDYYAVSYHFPEGSPAKAIEILKRPQYQTGFEATYEPQLISEILHAALCRFRDSKITIPLFMDSLCINYKDPKETASQVALLPRVFYNACHVCVWLGEDTNGSVNLDSFLSKVLDLSNVDNIVKSESQPEEWQAFAELMMRPWFGRRWVIQELISACDVTVYYGNDLAIDWQDFSDAVALFASKIEEIRELFKTSARFNHNPNYLVDIRALSAYTLVEASRNLFRQSSDVDNIRLRADLETLVSYFPAQQAFMPQDTIYSLLGISSDRPESPSDHKAPVFQVNYEKSPRLVFKEFVEYCIQKSKSLDIICRHWAPRSNITKASLETEFTRQRPSWISDVSGLAFGIRGTNQYGRNNGDSLVGTPDRRYYNASKGTQGMAIFGESQTEYASTALVQISSASKPLLDNLDGSMTVSGFKLGMIEQLGPRSNEGIILQEWIEIAGWNNEDAAVPAYFWRTLIADRGPDGVPPPTWYHRACSYCLDKTGGGDVSIAQLSVRSCPSMAINFLTRVRNIIWNRKFLRTSTEDGEGLYGLAPSKAEIGDTICVLYGCSVPVVLRRHPKNKLAWELVGECFVYGMMDGEAMESEMSGHSQEFELR